MPITPTMKLSSLGRKFLALQEGFRCKPYRDAAGFLTVGVGHLITQSERSSGRIEINGQPVKYTLHGLTTQQVYDLLGQDVGRFENAVNHAVNVQLAQHQFDALVSFAFNVGACAFKESTLVKEINAGRWENVPAQFMRWTRAAGKVLKGLERRRLAEVYVWENGYDDDVRSEMGGKSESETGKAVA